MKQTRELKREKEKGFTFLPTFGIKFFFFLNHTLGVLFDVLRENK